ncbi:hypothetical protein ABH897_002330 [Paenibacillus sp. RC73]
MKDLIVTVILAVAIGMVVYNGMHTPQSHKAPAPPKQTQTATTGKTVQLEFPTPKYPETLKRL